jgi:hypothetical protein
MFGRKNRNPAPDVCDCQELTQVDGEGDRYYPKDSNGKPTGHHPECEYYVPPRPFDGRSRRRTDPGLG